MKSMLVKMLALNLVLSAGAFASVRSSVGVWRGDGSAFDLSGKKQGNFGLKVTTTAMGEHEVKSDIEVSLPDGKVKHYEQRLVDRQDGFSIKSDQGDGGGHCLSKGLCQAYISQGSQAFAITIVLDGEDARRMLVTELKDGKAVGQVAERLIREN